MGNSSPKRRRRRISGILLALLVILSFWSAQVYASAQVGTLRISCKVQQNGDSIPLAGDTYAIAQVAQATVSQQDITTVTYQTNEVFSDFDCDWSALTDGELQAKAQVLQKRAEEEGLLDDGRKTGSDGTVSFYGLSTGLYLVVRTASAPDNAQYTGMPFLVAIPTIVDGEANYDVTAVPKFEHTPIQIRPANVTIYMGGNEGYDNVQGQENNNSLPKPMFVIQTPDGVEADRLIFEDSATRNQWKAVYIGHDEEGNACYRFDLYEGTGQDIQVRYVAPDGNVIGQDVFIPRLEHELYKLYEIEIPLGDTDDFIAFDENRVYPVETGTAVLTVRGVEDKQIAGNEENPVTDVISAESEIPVIPAEVGVAAVPAGTSYTLNETDIQTDDLHGDYTHERIGLLFDGIINDVYDRETVLEEQADACMPELEEGAHRYFQSKYLDLVDMNNGNAWVMASDPIQVYWGYPEGTDQNTSFTLWHFAGLHRDGTDDPGESGYDLEDIMAVDPEKVEITNTSQGICFTVEPGGFSPFVLVWEENNTPDTPSDESSGGTPESEGKPVQIPFLPQTGDNSALWVWAGILVLSASGVAVLSFYKKKRR